MQKALITGSSGFIGFHLCKRLLEAGFVVIGVDNLSNYYDRKIKKSRQKLLENYKNFFIYNEDIQKKDFIMSLFKSENPEFVVHLAAQAGVRYSIENPRTYLENNIIGTFEILDAAKFNPPKHTLLASTSSAYGINTKIPFKEDFKSDNQISFYAATKKATENMSYAYSHNYELPITIFRFFTVYGPWGRPDMGLI